MEDLYSKLNELYAIHDWYFCADRLEKKVISCLVHSNNNSCHLTEYDTRFNH
jgi:hypothetical protein